MRVLIVEDELPAARRLERLLKSIVEEVEICAITDSIQDSVKWLKNNPGPDLIFLDIHLADGYSFSIFDQVDCEAPVIFITAYDEFALKAFELNSIDYLLKPVDETLLRRSLEKYEKFSRKNIRETTVNLEQLISRLSVKSNYKSRFLVKSKDRLITVEDSQIAYFLASNKMVMIVTYENRYFPMEDTLAYYEKILDPEMFFRLNRSVISNRRAIRDIITDHNGKLQITLHPVLKEKVFISRDRAGDFKDWLES